MRRLITLKTFTASDLASAESDKSDFTVIMTAGVTMQGEIFFLDKWVKRGGEATEILKEFIRQMMYYRSTRGFMEKNRYESLLKTCRKLVARGYYGDPFTIRKIINRISQVAHYGEHKENRIVDGLQQAHKAHQLWFRSGWEDVRDQFILYPAVSYDDILDTIEMLVSHSTSPSIDVKDTVGDLVEGQLGRRGEPTHLTINEQLAQRPYNIWTGGKSRANRQTQRRAYILN